MRNHVTISLSLSLALAGCGYTGVHVQPDFVKAEQVPSEWDSAVTAQAAVLASPIAPRPAKPSGASGAQAIVRGQKESRIKPRQSEIDGTIWRIDDVDNTKIYVIPVAPLSPTTLRLPEGESLSEGGAVSGSPDDFTATATVSGNRSAVVVMPRCAAQGTKRFGQDEDPDTPFIRPCLSNTAKMTFLTAADAYNFELQVNDYAAASIVEINHAPPPPTNLVSVKMPRPTGPVEELRVFPEGQWNPGWKPRRAWADPDKMVIEFDAPLPVQPGLFPLGGNVNYSVIETDKYVWMVTSRSVTEARLMLDEQIVRISSPRAKELLASANSPRPKDWRD